MNNHEINNTLRNLNIRQNHKIYQKILIRKWNKFYNESRFPWGFDLDPDLKNIIPNFPVGSRVLDFGCGTAKNALYLAETGHKVTAIDFSSVAMRQANMLIEKRSVSGIKFICTENIDSQGEFDIVICLGVLHGHLKEDIMLIVKNLQKALKTGGYLLVKVWNREDPECGKGESCEEGTFWHYLGFWVHYFDRDEFISLFPAIEKISVYQSSETETHGGKHWHSSWVLWGRKR